MFAPWGRSIEGGNKTHRVPVKYVSYVKDVMTEEIPEGLSGELFPMEFNMRKTWM